MTNEHESRRAAERGKGKGPAEDPGREVRAHLESRRHDPGTRWHMSPHTLELAISALEGPARHGEGRDAPRKRRRRRRHKRFL